MTNNQFIIYGSYNIFLTVFPAGATLLLVNTRSKRWGDRFVPQQ